MKTFYAIAFGFLCVTLRQILRYYFPDVSFWIQFGLCFVIPVILVVVARRVGIDVMKNREPNL
jgi:hypothetical protein